MSKDRTSVFLSGHAYYGSECDDMADFRCGKKTQESTCDYLDKYLARLETSRKNRCLRRQNKVKPPAGGSSD
ncbi:hypothetical protein E1A04_23695 [Salmonella enterica subsp. enterica serovar Virchow]|nr:hypothetical protein [Salmonella enterica subsp. enterica serovar Virchow]ECD4427623.1 hypothetical protein [Salmonella enterica subsp. enterica serovar Virchow]